MQLTKKCTKCGEVKPATNEYFDIQKTGKYGFVSQCKVCRKSYYEKNKDKLVTQIKSYYEKNKDKIAARNKSYREKNKDKIAARNKSYREKNKDKLKAYREENKDKLKAYYEENKDKIVARKKSYYEKNKDKLAVRYKSYRESLPDAYIKHCLGLSGQEVPQDIIETRRLIIKLKKQLKNGK